MEKLRVMVCASGEFAGPTLRSLISDPDYDVVALVTQPDRPVGRKQVITPPAAKQVALEAAYSGAIEQPQKLSEVADDLLQKYSPDIILVADYGQMIPKSMLDAPRYGCLNLHGSLLPKLRGAVPMPMAILQGEEKTGVTLQQMVLELDAGDIWATREVKLTGQETAGELKQHLAELGADLVVETLPQLVAGEMKPTKQAEDEATYCYKHDLAKERAEITFHTPVELAERMVRAFNPWPVAWFALELNGAMKRIKVYKAKLKTENLKLETRNLQLKTKSLKLKTEGKKLFLVLGDGELELLELQLAGKERRSAKDYLYLAQ